MVVQVENKLARPWGLFSFLVLGLFGVQLAGLEVGARYCKTSSSSIESILVYKKNRIILTKQSGRPLKLKVVIWCRKK